MTRFLSSEHMEEATAMLNSDTSLSLGGVDLGVQFVVKDDPTQGEVDYYLDVRDGTARMALGTLDQPDVKLTSDHETAVGIWKGEINTQQAFVTGRFKFEGNMAKVMLHQNLISELPRVLSDLDLDY